MAPTPPLPPKYHGVWSRTLLQTSDGEVDTTTTVRWLQTRRVFGDVRVAPGLAPILALPSLDACDEAALAALAEQNAFAGVAYEDADAPGRGTSVMTWQRLANWHPPGGPPDTGRVRWVSEHKMYEARPTRRVLLLCTRRGHGTGSSTPGADARGARAGRPGRRGVP